MKGLFLTLGLLAFAQTTFAAYCEILEADPDAHGTEYGLIFVPGAQIGGQYYGPLMRKIQQQFPGKLWLGLTEGWFGNFPNPLEIDGAIKDCLNIAQ